MKFLIPIPIPIPVLFEISDSDSDSSQKWDDSGIDSDSGIGIVHHWCSHSHLLTLQEATQYADDHKLIYIETSAKTNNNIDSLFEFTGISFPAY